MHLLNVKLLRDIWNSRWQFLAVVAMVMLGIAFYQSSWMSYLNIGSSYEMYYRMTHFHDFEIPCRSAPDTVGDRLRRVPGITAAEARIVEEAEVDLTEDGEDRVMGRFISLPDGRSPTVDDVLVEEGSELGPPHKKDVLVERSFAEHHELKVGDTIHPVVFGQQHDYRIAGIAVSPEYIYAIESKQYLMPTPQTFGVFWVRRDQAERLFGMAGRASSVVARTAPGKLDRGMRVARQMLRSYGPEEPVARADQPSNYLLQMDLDGYRALAVFFPLLFLFSAALTIYTLMVRIVNSQRNQIGFLRASGVPVYILTRHYLLYSLTCGALGSLLGTVLGSYLSWLLTRFYLTVIAIPVIASPVHWDSTAFGVLVGILSCGIAGHYSARRVAMLRPAEAIREEAVEPGHTPIIERIVPRKLRESFIWQVPVRNIFRNARRTVYTVIGIALAIVLLLVSLGSRDSSMDSISVYLEEIMRYDLQAVFLPPQTESVEFHVAQLPGVTGAEAALEVPVELRRGDRVVNTVIIGLQPGSHLETLVAPDGSPIRVHDDAVLMSESNRKKLGVETGDIVHLAFARNDEDVHVEVPVSVGTMIRQPVGSYVYMSSAAVRRIFERELGLPMRAVTTLRVRGKQPYLRRLKDRILRMPNVAAVEESRHMRTQLEEAIEMNMAFSMMMILLGAGLAFAVIYNTVTINIMERTRELASMRAQGMSRWTIAALITIENLITGIMGLVVGIPLGAATNHVFMSSFENEIMSFEPVIYAGSYATTVGAVLAVIILSQIPGIVHINRMNLAEATKLRTG